MLPGAFSLRVFTPDDLVVLEELVEKKLADVASKPLWVEGEDDDGMEQVVVDFCDLRDAIRMQRFDPSCDARTEWLPKDAQTLYCARMLEELP